MTRLSADVPARGFDSDSATVTTTATALSALFSNLTASQQQSVMLANTGATEILIGGADRQNFPLGGGDALSVHIKDLAIMKAKVASGSGTLAILQII